MALIEDNVVRFLEHVSSYAFDGLDEAALTGALAVADAVQQVRHPAQGVGDLEAAFDQLCHLPEST